MSVGLDTTYSGEYRIGDGEWTPIDGTLTVAGRTRTSKSSRRSPAGAAMNRIPVGLGQVESQGTTARVARV